MHTEEGLGQAVQADTVKAPTVLFFPSCAPRQTPFTSFLHRYLANISGGLGGRRVAPGPGS